LDPLGYLLLLTFASPFFFLFETIAGLLDAPAGTAGPFFFLKGLILIEMQRTGYPRLWRSVLAFFRYVILSPFPPTVGFFDRAGDRAG